MKMPGTEIHSEVAVEHCELRRFAESHLEDGALDTRSHRDVSPMIFEQPLDESVHRIGGRREVPVFGDAPVQLLDNLVLAHVCGIDLAHGTCLWRIVDSDRKHSCSAVL